MAWGVTSWCSDSRLNARSNKDTILDWNYRDDTIQLENAIFRKLAKTGTLNKAFFTIRTAAKNANDYIIYNKNTGDLSSIPTVMAQAARWSSPALERTKLASTATSS